MLFELLTGLRALDKVHNEETGEDNDLVRRLIFLVAIFSIVHNVQLLYCELLGRVSVLNLRDKNLK